MYQYTNVAKKSELRNKKKNSPTTATECFIRADVCQCSCVKSKLEGSWTKCSNESIEIEDIFQKTEQVTCVEENSMFYKLHN